MWERDEFLKQVVAGGDKKHGTADSATGSGIGARPSTAAACVSLPRNTTGRRRRRMVQRGREHLRHRAVLAKLQRRAYTSQHAQH